MASFSESLRNDLKQKALEYISIKGFKNYQEYASAIIIENIDNNFLDESFSALEKVCLAPSVFIVPQI